MSCSFCLEVLARFRRMSLVEFLEKNSSLELSNKFEQICNAINDPLDILKVYFDSNPILTATQEETIKIILKKKVISSLSQDVISHSLSFLSFKEVTKLKIISKDFNRICTSTRPSSISFSSLNAIAKCDKNFLQNEEKQEKLFKTFCGIHSLHFDQYLRSSRDVNKLMLTKQFHYLKTIQQKSAQKFKINILNYPKLETFYSPNRNWKYETVPSSLKHIKVNTIFHVSIPSLSNLFTINFKCVMHRLGCFDFVRCKNIVSLFDKYHKNSFLVDLIQSDPRDTTRVFYPWHSSVFSLCCIIYHCTTLKSIHINDFSDTYHWYIEHYLNNEKQLKIILPKLKLLCLYLVKHYARRFSIHNYIKCPNIKGLTLHNFKLTHNQTCQELLSIITSIKASKIQFLSLFSLSINALIYLLEDSKFHACIQFPLCISVVHLMQSKDDTDQFKAICKENQWQIFIQSSHQHEFIGKEFCVKSFFSKTCPRCNLL